jgi:hypothetical protein
MATQAEIESLKICLFNIQRSYTQMRKYIIKNNLPAKILNDFDIWCPSASHDCAITDDTVNKIPLILAGYDLARYRLRNAIINNGDATLLLMNSSAEERIDTLKKTHATINRKNGSNIGVMIFVLILGVIIYLIGK